MSDNEIRKLLIEERKQERRIQREIEIEETVRDAAAWLCWGALGFVMFLGAYMIG